MTWTVETITNFLKENAAKLGHNFNIPVKINARFSSTLGAMRYIHNWDGTDTPTSIDISKQLIENASDKSIESTLLHELAHWVAIVEDPDNKAHGHDAVFKEICHRLGCDNDKTTANVEYLVNEEKIYKYFDNGQEICIYEKESLDCFNIYIYPVIIKDEPGLIWGRKKRIVYLILRTKQII